MRFRFLLFGFLLAFSWTSSAQTRVLPVDQAASAPDFFSFRAQFAAAIARRDTIFLLSALNKDVKLSFGGDAGIEAFKTMWRPAEPDSRVWDVLGTTLALGGTFSSEGTFIAPYIFTQWPKETDPFSNMASIGTGVRVRSAPAATAPVIGSLDFYIVAVIDQPTDAARWVKVRIAPNKTGYVDARFLRSPIDYRVNFAKLDGRWQVVSFLAGD